MNSKQPNIIAILGPTASGKSSLALKLAQEHNGALVNVDSSIVYRGLDIGSAKPDKAEQALVPHYLIDICEPDQTYSAGQFVKDATNAIDEIYTKGQRPFLVGGTMLYFRALLFGLAKMPSRDEKIREKLEQEKSEIGLDAMHDKLKEIDPKAAQKINRNDWQRIERALEVFYATNKTISEWHQEQPEPSFPYPVTTIALRFKDKNILHERIKKRLDIMLEQGFIDEVKKLRENKKLTIDTPSMRAVGYHEAWQYLDGTLTYDEMYELIIIATRQLAKHQMTWLKKWPNLIWFDVEDKNLEQKIYAIFGLS